MYVTNFINTYYVAAVVSWIITCSTYRGKITKDFFMEKCIARMFMINKFKLIVMTMTSEFFFVQYSSSEFSVCCSFFFDEFIIKSPSRDLI